MISKGNPASRRAFLAMSSSCAATAVASRAGIHGLAAARPARNARDDSAEAKIWCKDYWAKKGDVSLYLFRKRIGDPAANHETRPILFLAHGSSVSSRPTFDLTVPGHNDYSLMDKFAGYGFNVWTMDFEGYGRS